MSKTNKLQNIKAIQQMIDGTHKFQSKKTVGFSDAKAQARKSERHEVGDMWEETDAAGMVWVIEQKDGFRVRKTKNTEVFQEVRDELRKFTNCRKDTCTCLNPKPADEKMRKLNGMCLDCTVDWEHEMRKAGTYDEYEKQRVRQNAEAWLQQAEKDVEMLKQTYTQASKFVVNSEGELETWAAQMTPEEFEEKIEKSFAEFKERFIKRLNGENNENN
jgi:hypothetical protein